MSPLNYSPIDKLLEKYKNDVSQRSASISKEGEPINLSIETLKKQENDTQPAETTQEREKNMEQFIQPVDEDQIQLDPQLKKAGLQVVDTSKLSLLQKIQLPISDEKIIEGLEKPYTSSWRWLSVFGIYLLGQAHIALKTIHGKVIRVLKK